MLFYFPLVGGLWYCFCSNVSCSKRTISLRLNGCWVSCHGDGISVVMVTKWIKFLKFLFHFCVDMVLQCVEMEPMIVE